MVDASDCLLANVGPTKVARVLIDKEGMYKFQVLNATLHTGTVHDGTIETYLYQMKINSGFFLCPEVEQAYNEVKSPDTISFSFKWMTINLIFLVYSKKLVSFL